MILTQVAPEMVLGKDVFNNQGLRVGTVADVGLHDMRRVKYLLIQNEGTAQLKFMRLGVERINAINSRNIVVKGDTEA